MATFDEKRNGILIGRYTEREELAKAIYTFVHFPLEDVVFVCIGTDRSTGDCFGPLVGTYLQEQGVANVIGTIDNPVHALNLDERLQEVPQGKIVVAIDASLGKLKNVGSISLNKGALSPGAGVDKELTKVGDYSIHGVVNVKGFMEMFLLQSTRLSMVMQMAKTTATSIIDAFSASDIEDMDLHTAK